MKLFNSLQKLFTKNNLLILGVAFFITLTGNFALFSRLIKIYPFAQNISFLFSLTVFFWLTSTLFLMALCHQRFARWTLSLFLIIAAIAAFFMDSYGVIIDDVMIENIIQSDLNEVKGLLSLDFLIRVVLLGIIPALIVLKFAPKVDQFRHELKSKIIFLALSLPLIFLVVFPYSADYADFIREHKTVRFYANPSYFIYSTGLFLKNKITKAPTDQIQPIAQDAYFVSGHQKKELIILVVGETAREDRFSLNGYSKLTNPLLQKQSIISFKNVVSCGTSTGVSVPCMFSSLKRKDFDNQRASQIENVLDVLRDHGVKVLWRDNNSDSKGVALRVQYEDFKTPTKNPVCDNECRDIGMLAGLEKFLGLNKQHDILIVLHQMGNHGPEYYRRYPNEFEKFKPVCKKSRLSMCSKEEIDNAYDNAILYTDYFLSNTIDFLKKYDKEYETAMFYVADHGESLGEHDIYLHAAPYLIAPEEQKHVPAILWLGSNFDYHLKDFKRYENKALDHSDLFCALLGAFELKAEMCESAKTKLILNDNDSR